MCQHIERGPGAPTPKTHFRRKCERGAPTPSHFVVISPSGVSHGVAPVVPQRVVHPQTGARYVPEGERGVIPLGSASAELEGVIPRFYFITVL